jgi:hypothetical protein
MPWDGRRAGWVRNVNNRQHELATPDELVELIALLRNMQPTIAGGAEFGLVHQLKFIAFFNSAAFTREGATFRAIQGLTIPGITDESDHMKRLSNFWRVLRQGDLYSLRGREITDHAPRKFMCAGGGRSWVEYVEPRWGKAHPLFALGVPYYDYTFAPMAYVPTDKTRREEL